jgi:putative protease
MRQIELLAPAKNLEIGIEAIKHGADAVYIGGPSFGARAAAGNSVKEITELCQFAHFYGAKVYVTFNTILYDHELEEARKLIYQLHDAGVDALIVQDLALCRMKLPPIELHASTQLDITSVEKAQMLEQAGFKQIVLARELPLAKIREIRKATNVEIEAFVHGALCVSYSGRCYASEHCFKRSANRGQCAQFCRLPFTLKDANGRIIRKDKHLLSLRDMNRSESVEEMINAGVKSFKIEGRLKDLSYVKNVTAYYRNVIDSIIAKRSDELCRSSFGRTRLQFTPQLDKSFNRKFTEYFLHEERHNEAHIDAPKSMGEHIGKITGMAGNRLEVVLREGIKLVAGDGLCLIDYEGKLQGFRANTVSHTSKRNTFIVTLFGKQPFPFTGKHSLDLYRNLDSQFEKLLEKETAHRKLLLKFRLEETAEGFALKGTDEMGRAHTELILAEHQPSKSPQRENMMRQLLKVGDSPYEIEDIELNLTQDWFIPSSVLANARRNLILALTQMQGHARTSSTPKAQATQHILKDAHLDYTANIANQEAQAYYESIGAASCDPAFELAPPKGKKAIMFCKYCIRHELGMCKKKQQASASQYTEPFMLHSADGSQYELSFNCKDCEMSVWALI